MGNVLVIGASSGIGRATAKYLNQLGYHVIAVARRKDCLEELKKEAGGNIDILAYDICDMDNMESIFKYTLNIAGKLDGMVFSAGINRDMPIATNDVQDMKDVFATNVMSFVELGKYFYKKRYSNDASSIVAISSCAQYSNYAGMCTYSASKAALTSVVNTMSKEFVRRKIRVNSISPGFVDTPMYERTKNYVVDIVTGPLGLIQPVHISYMVEYLLSEKAIYITGIDIPISAG